MRSGIGDPVFETKSDGTEKMFPLFFQSVNLVSLLHFSVRCVRIPPK